MNVSTTCAILRWQLACRCRVKMAGKVWLNRTSSFFADFLKWNRNGKKVKLMEMTRRPARTIFFFSLQRSRYRFRGVGWVGKTEKNVLCALSREFFGRLLTKINEKREVSNEQKEWEKGEKSKLQKPSFGPEWLSRVSKRPNFRF